MDQRQSALVLSGGDLHDLGAKTTHGLLRGSEHYRVLGVIDEKHPGQDAGTVMDGRPLDIPIFGDLESALAALSEKPKYCIIGVATIGGVLPPHLLVLIKKALEAGISVVNGLHEFLSEKPELVALAAAKGLELIDVRKPKTRAELHFWTGEIFEVKASIVAVLGLDCAMGKRTTARILRDACRKAGRSAEMIYTGQTGWMQGNKYGFIFDSTLNDFISGELEHAIVSCWRETQSEVILLEGQSALRNPSGPAGAEYLVSGNAKKVVLVVPIGRQYFEDLESWGPLPSVEDEMALIRLYGAEVVGIAMNTRDCTVEEVRAFKEKYEALLGVPVVDPLSGDLGDLVGRL
jgi:uncharacterized NAD-dependent epimerase/dehydratase family protein